MKILGWFLAVLVCGVLLFLSVKYYMWQYNSIKNANEYIEMQLEKDN